MPPNIAGKVVSGAAPIQVLAQPRKVSKKRTIKDDVTEVLRKRNNELLSRIKALEVAVKERENESLKSGRRADAAEKQAEIFFDAIRILAGTVPNNLAAGRAAREEARRLIEGVNARPPHTLGASRKRKSKKGGKKKT